MHPAQNQKKEDSGVVLFPSGLFQIGLCRRNEELEVPASNLLRAELMQR